MSAGGGGENRGWPGYLPGGRIRTSTAALILAFLAIWWLHATYRPAPEPPPQVPAFDVVPPGFIPDPSYTWVPRSDVMGNPTEVTPTTPTTPETPEISATPAPPEASGTAPDVPPATPTTPAIPTTPAPPPPQTPAPAPGAPTPSAVPVP